MDVHNSRTRYELEGDNSLTISNIERSDSGEYVCRASNGVGDPAYEYLTLTVHGMMFRYLTSNSDLSTNKYS